MNPPLPPQDGSPPPETARRGVLPAEVAGRFPRLGAYLAALPAGMRSYPECRVRMATYAGALLGGPPERPHYEGVDPRVRAFLGEPPRGLWIPEVHLMAGIAAVGDQYDLSREQHYDWLLERNRALFKGGIYRAVMAFLSPELLLRKASDRWTSFHQGTELSFQRTSPNAGLIQLTFPPSLLDEAVARVFGAVFVAAIERANASSAELSVREDASTHVVWLIEWR